MEDVLSLYQKPYDPRFPQVCLDEASKQLLSDARPPLPMEPGQPQRIDSEYERNGTANMFMIFEPLRGFRHVEVTERRTAMDFAHIIKLMVDVHYPHAEKIRLVMDNLNTHKPASLYEAFPPEEAKRLYDKLEIHYTPKHGSWLDMAEIELSVLARQALSERMETKEHLAHVVAAWEQQRNHAQVKVHWRFTTDDARIKLKRLYPTILPG